MRRRRRRIQGVTNEFVVKLSCAEMEEGKGGNKKEGTGGPAFKTVATSNAIKVGLIGSAIYRGNEAARLPASTPIAPSLCFHSNTVVYIKGRRGGGALSIKIRRGLAGRIVTELAYIDTLTWLACFLLSLSLSSLTGLNVDRFYITI
jgi:hypothetical protein